MLALAAGIVAVPAFTVQWLAPRIPFSVEVRLAAPYVGESSADDDVRKYLQALADRLARAQELPREIAITIHYKDEPVVNAFATLGGHVFIYRGLLAAMPDENALAMVVAHEIAHVLHRHPVQALGRGIATGVVISAVSTVAGNSVASRVMGDAGLLTVLTFNRNQEEQADAVALRSLARVYGHLAGADDLFRELQRSSALPQPPRLLSTHPLTDDRIRRIGAIALENGWPRDGERTPIPDAIRTAVRPQ